MNRKDRIEENDVVDAILTYGKDILNSDLFRQAANEKHHLHGTVLDFYPHSVFE